MCTVLGMLPRVPLTNSATSCTVNICRSSSNIAGNELRRAACRVDQERQEQCKLDVVLITQDVKGLLAKDGNLIIDNVMVK